MTKKKKNEEEPEVMGRPKWTDDDMTEAQLERYLAAVQAAPRVEQYALGRMVRYHATGEIYEVVNQPYFDADYALMVDLKAADSEVLYGVEVINLSPVTSLEALGDQAE